MVSQQLPWLSISWKVHMPLLLPRWSRAWARFFPSFSLLYWLTWNSSGSPAEWSKWEMFRDQLSIKLNKRIFLVSLSPTWNRLNTYFLPQCWKLYKVSPLQQQQQQQKCVLPPLVPLFYVFKAKVINQVFGLLTSMLYKTCLSYVSYLATDNLDSLIFAGSWRVMTGQEKEVHPRFCVISHCHM